MNSAKQQELITDHENILEDLHEGLIALENVLRLLRQETGGLPVVLPISRGQVIAIAFHLTGRLSYDVDTLASVKTQLPPASQEQLYQLRQRFQRQAKRVQNLKLFGKTHMPELSA